MKVKETEIVVSSHIEKDLLGVFSNSFHLCNAEFHHKTEVPEVSKFEGEEIDERKTRITKKIEKFDISAEDSSFKESEEFKFWNIAASSNEYAKKMCLLRSNEGDPDYIEKQVKALVKK
jgi:hypothetical protein